VTSPAGPAGASSTAPIGSRSRRRRLGDLLVESGTITTEQLAEALTVQAAEVGRRRRLGRVLIDMGIVDEATIAQRLGEQLGLPMVNLTAVKISSEVIRYLPQRMSERHSVCLLEVNPGSPAVLAMADPTDVFALDDVRLSLRSDVHPVVALESQIREAVTRAWAMSSGEPEKAQAGPEPDEDTSDEAIIAAGAASTVDDSPIVKIVDQILRDAVTARASDIHLEPQREDLRVRFRVDGLLREVFSTPKSTSGSIVSRIKIISGLDISERRVPQDGRTRITVQGHEIDARVSTLPSLHGEKVVIRILTRGDNVPTLDQLGFEADQLEAFERALTLPQGLILITGPTGSGKTNTLYAGINAVLTPDKNFVTLEDPVEVQLPGITQVQVNTKTGMTFQAGLRSVLRQDPDIVLVGEVRDTETTELALKAAMTGHLVLTTLHTNSAVAALTRLIDMGADPFLVASSLVLAIAQRLVRTPCKECAQPYEPPDDQLALLGLHRADLAGATPLKGAGCAECGGTGYRGRTAVYEVLEVDAAMRKVLIKDPSEASVGAQAKEAGLQTLRASALLKAMNGRTTFEEVLRVTTTDRAEGHACPACSRPVESSMIACPWCAAQLADARCQRCQKPLEDGWVICPWCRAATPGHEATHQIGAAAPTEAPAPTIPAPTMTW
jgi:type IV pilus assembly protein PilB